MLTLDLPALCRGCSHHTSNMPSEQESLPVVDWWHNSHCGGAVPSIPSERLKIEAQEPQHLARQTMPPVFRWQRPDGHTDLFHLVVGIAGTWNSANRVYEVPADSLELELPESEWMSFPPNTGLWWFIVAIDRADLSRTRRSTSVRCIVRHEPIPRIEGSTLYDRDHLHERNG